MPRHHLQFNMMHTLELANTHIDGDVSNLVGCKSLEVSRRVVLAVWVCVGGGVQGPWDRPFVRVRTRTSIIRLSCQPPAVRSSHPQPNPI